MERCGRRTQIRSLWSWYRRSHWSMCPLHHCQTCPCSSCEGNCNCWSFKNHYIQFKKVIQNDEKYETMIYFCEIRYLFHQIFLDTNSDFDNSKACRISSLSSSLVIFWASVVTKPLDDFSTFGFLETWVDLEDFWRFLEVLIDFSASFCFDLVFSGWFWFELEARGKLKFWMVKVDEPNEFNELIELNLLYELKEMTEVNELYQMNQRLEVNEQREMNEPKLLWLTKLFNGIFF